MSPREGVALAPALHSEIPSPGTPARICIASLEVNGPTRNGGIGTAYATLAEKLAGAGHEVTLLYLLGRHTEHIPIETWIDDFIHRGVELVPLEHGEAILEGSRSLQISYLVYRWLAEQERRGQVFDVIHFHEWLAFGYYSLLARHQGVALTRSTICVGMHSPSLWIEEANQRLLDDVALLECDALERRCVELADIVWSPSRYLLNWITDRGWHIAGQTWIHPNPAPEEKVSGTVSHSQECETVPDTFFTASEAVFFGRLETRKGLVLFCDALDQLTTGELPEMFRVTFLGKPCIINGEDAAAYLRQRAVAWPFPIKVHSDCGHDEALAYLRQPGRLAVMPSLIENCPLTVIECVSLGIPFLASAVGGIPELVAEECHDEVLFAPTVAELVARLRQAFTDGIRLARPAMEPDDCDRIWDQWHRTSRSAQTRESQPNEDEYLLLREPGTRLAPGAAEMFRRIAKRTGADILTALEDSHDDEGGLRRHLFGGVDSGCGVARNCFGGGTMLIRRSAYTALAEDPAASAWEFHARAVLRGFRLEVVPEPLIFRDRTAAPPDPQRVLQPFLEEVPAGYRDLIRLAQGQARRIERLEERLRQSGQGVKFLRYRLADLVHGWLGKIPLLSRALRAVLACILPGNSGERS
jgi:glycosyltransferase involved in cell wall biosynthesis